MRVRTSSATSFDPDAPATADSGIYGLPFTPADAHVIIIPVPFEATTSYGGGTSRGPDAILEASRQVDLHDTETGRPYSRGIAMLEIPQVILSLNSEAKDAASPIIAAGGEVGDSRELRLRLDRVNAIGAEVNGWVRSQAERVIAEGKMAVVLGGDHSVPFGAIEAYAARYPGLGILHLDAHSDLREAYEGFTWSHASIFYNVMTRAAGVGKLVQVAVRDAGSRELSMIERSNGRIVPFFDHEIASRKDDGEPFARVADAVVAELPHHVYLSWDIDGLDPTLCPNTGTPVPGGLSWNEAVALLRAIVRSGREIVGLDLCEVSPGETEWDANVGARLLYKMIGFALLSQAKQSS